MLLNLNPISSIILLFQMRKQLASVEFANLLQINWNEQKIQHNFKTIVDALTEGDKDRLILKEEVQSLKDEVEFIKSMVARQGDGNTNQVGNVQNQTAPQRDNDPFKFREMIQKLQKQSKQMSNRQTDQDGLLQKIQQIQSELREDLHNSETKREDQNTKIRDNTSKEQSRQNQEHNNGQNQGQNQDQRQKQRLDQSKSKSQSQSKTVVSNPKLSQMQFGDDKKQKQKLEDKENQTAFKKEKTLTSIKDIHQNLLEIGDTGAGTGTNTKTSNQLSQLLAKIEQLKSDNLKITARLNSYDQALQGLRKLPVQASRLKSTIETKPITPVSTDGSKLLQQKTGANQNEALRSQIGEMKEDLSTLQEQINKYYLDANTLRLCYEEMKLWISDIKKSDNKKDILIHDLDQRTTQVSQTTRDDKDRIDLELKELRETILKIAMEQKPLPKQERQGTSSASQNERRRSALAQYDENYKDKINDKLSRLQALLMQAATQSDLERLRIQLKDNIQENNNKIQNVKTSVDFIDKKFEEMDLDQQSQNSEMKKLEGDIAGLSGLVNDKFGAIDKKGSITNNKIQDIRKHLQQLKEDLEHYKDNVNRLTQLTDGMQLVQVPKGDNELGGIVLQHRSSGDFGKKQYQQLRKQMLNKIHDNRQQLLNALKDFERRSNNKNTYEQDIVILFDKIGEIKQFLSKKADADDTKKSILYLQKKMSVAFSSLNNQDQNTEDARAAKKSWFCLSCDKVLQNYNGKVGKHIVWDSLGTSKFNTKVTMGSQEGKKPMKETLPSLRR